MIKKKLITALTIAAVFVASVMPVTAASPSTTNTGNQNPTATTEVDNSQRGQMSAADGKYNVTNNADGSVVSAIQSLLLNNLAATGNAFGNATIAAAATNSGVKISAVVLAAGDIEPSGATKDADGFYTVTLSVPGVQAGDTIAVLHKGANGWETIIPSAVGNGTVTFKVKSFSPFAIVKLVASGTVAAPQTGADMFAVYALALMGMAGAAYCSKKYFVK